MAVLTGMEIRSRYPIEGLLVRSVEAVLNVWPRAVIEDPNTGQILTLKSLGAGRTDVIMFEDHTAWMSWFETGWTESNAKQMVQIFCHADGTVTLALENPIAQEGLASAFRAAVGIEDRT